MTPLVHIYRRLDLVQRTKWFRIAATAVAVLVCAGVFGSLLITSYSIHNQRTVLQSALEGQSLARSDEHAVSLRDYGTVTVRGRTYRTHEFAIHPQFVFDDDGNIAAPIALVEDLLSDQGPAWAPRWLLEQPDTTWLLTIVATGWILLIIWLNVTLPFALTLLGTCAAMALVWLVGRQGSEGLVLAIAGIGLLTFTYVLLTRAAQALMNRPNQVLAVAHTVIKEASRTRMSLVFIVLLLILLPMLPLWLDPDAPLRFRVQTFISRSVGFTFVIAAFMTLFLSCSSVAFEIRDRQIWQLVTKPLSRFNYLLGKWLGVVTVNFILLLVAGVSTFTFVQYLRTLPVAQGIEGQLDRVQLENEVLTARVAAQPVYDQLTTEQVRARIDQIIERDPELMRDISAAERRDIADQVRKAYLTMQRSIPPQTSHSYIFEGLHEAKRRNATLALRYRFHILRSDQHETFPAIMVFNENSRLRRDITYVPTMSHVMIIGPDVVRDDGTLSVTVFNAYQPPPHERGLGSINFDETDFELLYSVASFEGNFFRAILVAWIKLAFLAMLGTVCATFLSFPVACLLAFTVFLSGTIGPFLATALLEYEPYHSWEMDWTNVGMILQWAFEWTIYWIAQGLVVSLQAFGEFKPTANLVEGKLIPWIHVLRGFGVLVVAWSGMSLVAGWLILRSRQLAIYSGQG